MTEERYTPPRPFRKIHSDVIRCISWLQILARPKFEGHDVSEVEKCIAVMEELVNYTTALHDRLVDLRFLGETDAEHTEPTVRGTDEAQKRTD